MDIPEEMFESAESYSDQILSLPGVSGWDVGIAEYDGELSSEYAIRIYVDDLRRVDWQYPSDFDGYPTNYLEGQFEFDVDTTRYDPLIAGCQVENGSLDVSSSGTLGLIVHHRVRDVLCGLTNAHVLCFGNFSRGDSICQPARTSSGPPAPADIVGLLFDWNFDHDCAIFELRESITPDLAMLGLGRVRGSRSVPEVDPNNFLRVSKRGVATGVTSGFIIGRNRISTTDQNGKTMPPHLLVRIDLASSVPPYSMEGDSGAGVLDDDGYAVGIHVGHYGPPYGLVIPWGDIAGCFPIDVAT
jgi:hypothetical protein